jgi:predicted nucleotidyltransferase
MLLKRGEAAKNPGLEDGRTTRDLSVLCIDKTVQKWKHVEGINQNFSGRDSCIKRILISAGAGSWRAMDSR